MNQYPNPNDSINIDIKHIPKQVHPHPADTTFIDSSLSSVRWLKIHRSSQRHKFARIGCSEPNSCESSFAMKITDMRSFLVWATTLDCDRGGKTGSKRKGSDATAWSSLCRLQRLTRLRSQQTAGFFLRSEWSWKFGKTGHVLPVFQELQDDQWPSGSGQCSNGTTAESAFTRASASANVCQLRIIQW